jgi:DNA-binding transcriptional LysR family regulator
MARENINDLLAFLAVAREQSFTKAAAKLGVSQSALSHTVKHLEQRLGVRLLTRTTRSVSPTQAGDHLIRNVGPRFEEIEAELEGLSEFREKPAGTIRISATDYVFNYVMWDKLVRFLGNYPDIKVELINDYGLSDIVAERCDAGVRMGDQVAKDMISARISPDIRFVVVGAESYFVDRTVPVTPQDLVEHKCINLRLPTYGGLYVWEFEKDGQELRVRVDGQVVFNNILQVLQGAIAGLGLAHMPEDMATPYLANGKLRQVLDDWCPLWEGYHLYYPSRRQSSPPLALLVDALRYRE